MHVTQLWPMRNKEKSVWEALEKVCSLLTQGHFYSRWMLGGTERTVVAYCDYDSNKTAKW